MKSKLLIVALLISIFNCSAQFTKLFDFDGSNGSNPFGDLIYDGTFLYGMTEMGGASNSCINEGGCGVVFKIKSDGTGFAKLSDFDSINGSHTDGSLVSDGTFLYGITSTGGTNNFGTIFKIKPDGLGFIKIHDFGNAYDGIDPVGSLLYIGQFLYGMTANGGLNGEGCIYKVKPDGTGYSKLYDFSGTANGFIPFGSLVCDGTFLYGMTSEGGIGTCSGTYTGCGVIFKIKLDGTSYSKLMDFLGNTNGSDAIGSLLFDGIFLYGMTPQGGTNDLGTIFRIKNDGSGYTKIIDFDNVNGSGPFGSLMFDGTFLYGMTNSGGFLNEGVIFKIKPDGTGFYKLHDFNNNNKDGRTPNGNLIINGSFLYGMATSGGLNNFGTIFKYDISTDVRENNLSSIINISPNPSNGIFQVTSTKHQISGIDIYTILGEKVYQSTNFQINTSSIDLSNQPNGIYFITIKTEQGIVSKKIIINR